MNAKLIQLYKRTKAFFTDAYERILEIRELTKAQTDMNELADWVYALRESYTFVDNLRKDIKAAMETCEKLACLFWIEMQDGDPIKTEYVTATPKVKMIASIPSKKKDPEQYAKLMNFLGVDEKLYDEIEVVRPHWPGFVEMVSQLAEKGLPLPDGIDPTKTFPQYSLIVRKQKGVDE